MESEQRVGDGEQQQQHQQKEEEEEAKPNRVKSTYTPVKTKSFVVNKHVNSQALDFESMSHEQLVVEATRLNNHVFQLRNLLAKAAGQAKPSTTAAAEQSAESVTDAGNTMKKKIKYKERPFDFGKYNKRHVLLKFAYLGWNYQGYTIQEGISQTVEHHLFEAFKRTKLVENRETSNYHRCGRTDKGNTRNICITHYLLNYYTTTTQSQTKTKKKANNKMLMQQKRVAATTMSNNQEAKCAIINCTFPMKSQEYEQACAFFLFC